MNKVSKNQNERIFFELFLAQTESQLETVIKKNKIVFDNPANWYPLGGNENSFGVIENQQSSPIASLIEKLTNSIDAIMMKRCLESKIDPKSIAAPQTIEEGVKVFFPDYRDWELPKFRRQQSENIQILADGPTKDTSVIIYDNGDCLLYTSPSPRDS